MNLVRRTNPTGLGRLQDQMNDLFENFFGDWSGSAALRAPLPMDISEDDEQITVNAELPGMKNDDIDISVQNDMLTISGEKKDERKETGRNFYHSERQYGRFQRSLRLPAPVDADKVAATYRDGVLSITLPKSEQARAKRITVQ
jgi:HSP20 family protein